MTRTSRLLRLLAPMLAAGVAACDPCSGVASCGAGDPRFSMDGQIVHAQDGRGVDGVRLDIIRTGGATIGADTLTVVTANGGFWHVAAPAGDVASNEVSVDVRITSPLVKSPYFIRGVKVPLVSRKGETFFADRWVADPYYPYYIEFFRRGAQTQVVETTLVRFKQTGGPLLRGLAPDSTIMTSTDLYGRSQFFLYNAYASDTGAVTGEATVLLRSPLAPSRVTGIRLSPTFVYRAPGIVPRVGAGPSLEYSAAIFDRATGRTMPGALVDFVRVGGIETDPASFQSRVDEFGYAHMHTLANGVGNVIMRITIRPLVGDPETFLDTIPTFDSDTPRNHANWSAGAYMPYYGLLRSFGVNIAGATVRVRRIGGILVAPADTTITTTSSGVVQLNPRPLGNGAVGVELTITPPPPYQRFIVNNVTLRTVQGESQGINVWTWDLERGPSGPPGTTVTVVP